MNLVSLRKIKFKLNLPYIYGPEVYMGNPNIYSGSGHLPDFWSNFTLLAGQIFRATFKIKFCSQCTMYWGGQCRNLGWWPF